MPGSCEGDPECGEGSGGVAGVVTEGSSDDEVAQARHRVWAATGPKLHGRVEELAQVPVNLLGVGGVQANSTRCPQRLLMTRSSLPGMSRCSVSQS